LNEVAVAVELNSDLLRDCESDLSQANSIVGSGQERGANFSPPSATLPHCHSRDNPDIWTAVRKLQRFCLPQFMIDKMKSFMHSVQGKWHYLKN